MAQKGGDFGGEINMGTDAWNVADGYTKLKILRQLILFDRWDTIAQFGTEELDEDNNYNLNQINKRRIEGLQRLQSTIKQLLGNVAFALKSTDTETVKVLIGRVKTTEEYIDKCYSVKNDMVSQEENFVINEKLFKMVLEILQDVKDKLNVPLNNAGLIFRQSEEVDLDQIMQSIVDSG